MENRAIGPQKYLNKKEKQERTSITPSTQGYQMVYLKNPINNLGKFWKALVRMEKVGIFYGHLVYFMAVW
jgi:hypothetical protein